MPPGFSLLQHGAQCGVFVGHVPETKCDADAVERAVGKRQLLRIDLNDRQVAGNAGIDETTAALAQHGGVDIGQHDMAVFTDLAAKRTGEVAGAAGEVQGDIAWPQRRLGNREALP